MQKILKGILILITVSTLLLTTACSQQAAAGKGQVAGTPEADAAGSHEPDGAELDKSAEPETEPDGTVPESEGTHETGSSEPGKTETGSINESETSEAAESAGGEDTGSEEETQSEPEITIEDTNVAMSDSTSEETKYSKTSAPGINEEKNGDAVIDYSNTSDGYVMVKFTTSTSNRLKALVEGPTTQYQYDLQPKEWAALPLSDGDGTYKIGIYENVRGTSYAQVLVKSINVELTDEFAPFLRSNQYVDFESAPETILKAEDLCDGVEDNLDKVEKVYDYVVTNFTYDYDLAASVASGYVPDLDKVLSKKKGICLDYAGIMTGMLRSQNVPCKLVVGYTGTAYHAWISVWTEETGWIENTIYFDGETWQRMDPTFASTGKQSEKTMQYIGDGKNYVAKYFY